MTGSTTVSEAAEHEVDPTSTSTRRDAKYVKIAVILGGHHRARGGAPTSGRTSSGRTPHPALVLSLFPMMIAKFAIVVGYFMHLKYDNPLFKRVFVSGLVLAIAVYFIVFFVFEYFDDRFFRFLEAG